MHNVCKARQGSQNWRGKSPFEWMNPRFYTHKHINTGREQWNIMQLCIRCLCMCNLCNLCNGTQQGLWLCASRSMNFDLFPWQFSQNGDSEYSLTTPKNQICFLRAWFTCSLLFTIYFLSFDLPLTPSYQLAHDLMRFLTRISTSMHFKIYSKMWQF